MWFNRCVLKNGTEGETNVIFTESQGRALRIKRAKLNLTKMKASQIIGISLKTYSRLEVGAWNANKEVFQKATTWLAEDFE